MKRIYAKRDYCIGCRLCEVHCVAAHSHSKDIVKAYKFERKNQPRFRIEESGAVSFAVQCRHCDEPFCVYSCISGAMSVDGNGAVVNDPERCVGCWTCILACPYGAISRDEAGGKIVSKCDLCAERAMPACVENCPNEALVYADVTVGKADG